MTETSETGTQEHCPDCDQLLTAAGAEWCRRKDLHGTGEDTVPAVHRNRPSEPVVPGTGEEAT